MSTTFTTDTGQDIGVDVIPVDDDTDYSDWFCISTDPFPCPFDGCRFIALHATAAHRIVVFPESDDERMLDLAAIQLKKGRNPRIVPYERSMGECITYDLWEALGRPVHAIKR